MRKKRPDESLKIYLNQTNKEKMEDFENLLSAKDNFYKEFVPLGCYFITENLIEEPTSR